VTAAAHLVPPDGPVEIVLGLGGNVGDRLGYLRRAVFALAAHPELTVTASSRIWESEYVGPGAQAPYLNLVLVARTELAPAALLAVGQALEQRLGRPRGGHMQPRTVDVDILFYGDRRGTDALLTLPHPRAAERGFVLGPLAELQPDRVLPDSGETVAAAWARIRAQADGRALRPLEEPLAGNRTGDQEAWRAALAVHCR
jgi:2-amino-4-hydroxy-6-hydroxymethyldihydropteridine diphosphokinase